MDDNNPLPPTQKPRGYGGVALLYNTNLNHTMKKVAAGCNRISAEEVLTDPPLRVCCVYMPGRNSKSNFPDHESYQLCIDQLEEIINTFSGTHALVIVGDMNASLRRRNGNNQDVILENFVKSNGLFCEQTGTRLFSIQIRLIEQRMTTSY